MCTFFFLKRFSCAVVVRHSWHCCHCWHCLPKAYSLHFSLYLSFSLSFLSCFALPNFLAYHSAAPRFIQGVLVWGDKPLGSPLHGSKGPVSLCFPWRSNTTLSTSPPSICHPPNGSSTYLLFSNAEIKRYLCNKPIYRQFKQIGSQGRLTQTTLALTGVLPQDLHCSLS